MFKYLFKIYKLRQLVKLREWHRARYRVALELGQKYKTQGDTDLFLMAVLDYQHHEKELNKLDHQIRLYE